MQAKRINVREALPDSINEMNTGKRRNCHIDIFVGHIPKCTAPNFMEASAKKVSTAPH